MTFASILVPFMLGGAFGDWFVRAVTSRDVIAQVYYSTLVLLVLATVTAYIFKF